MDSDYASISLQLVYSIVEYAGATVRKSDVFGQNKNALAMTKKFIKGLKVRCKSNGYINFSWYY